MINVPAYSQRFEAIGFSCYTFKVLLKLDLENRGLKSV